MAPGTISSETLDQPGLDGQSFQVGLDPNGRINSYTLESYRLMYLDLDAIPSESNLLQAQRAMFENNLMWDVTQTSALRGDGVWQQQRVNPYIYDNDRAGEGFYYGRTGDGSQDNPYRINQTWAEIQAYIEQVENITLEF